MIMFLIGLILGAGIMTFVDLTFTKVIGTIHIENDLENSGEKYIFDFTKDFHKVKNHQIVRLRIKDHTH